MAPAAATESGPAPNEAVLKSTLNNFYSRVDELYEKLESGTAVPPPLAELPASLRWVSLREMSNYTYHLKQRQC